MAIEYFPNNTNERPRTRIQIDSSAISGVSSGSDKIVMLVGSANDGKPNTVYKVRNYVQAKDIFKGGELLDALEMAWNPGRTTAGAGEILALRVEDSKSASKTFGGMKYTSKVFGADANSISVTIERERHPDFGLQSPVLVVKNPRENYTARYINIGDAFEIGYSGAGIGTMTIANGLLKLGVEVESVLTPNAEFALGPGPFENLTTLATAINAVPGFTARLSEPLGRNFKTANLDISSGDVFQIPEKPVKITAIGADIVNRLANDKYVSAEIEDKSVPPILPEEELVGGALTGGTIGTVPESWAEKFSLLANEGGYLLVPLTDKPSVHAEALAFVNERTNEGEPMRVIAGGSYDENANELLARASNLRNARLTLIGFSGTRASGTSNQVSELPAYMMASLVAGLVAGLPIGEPITFKNINISSLSRIFEGQELDTLNASGVVMTEFVRNRVSQTSFRIVDDVTTYNDRTNPVQNQMSIGESNDFFVSELKIELDSNFIGTRVVNISASLIKSAIQSFLERKKRANEIQDYSPEEIQVVINGEIANISLVIYPVRGLKQIEVALVYKQQDIIA